MLAVVPKKASAGPVSTSLTTVKMPSRKTAGSEIAANGTSRLVVPATNPIATSELESAMT